ncbi:MAG: response regulator transcription factor [Clostridiales bacterium]|nr:response regulator transcription factor [Clostridiales bacterium]
MEKIKVAICDDMKFICDYFSLMLKSNDRFEVIGTANDHDGVMALAKEKNPDVILLDLNFDKNNTGIDMISELKKLKPQCKIIIITVHDQGNLILEAITNGADNYLLKDMPVEELQSAIIDTYENKTGFSQRLLYNIASEANKIQQRQQSLLYIMTKLSTLSPREYEVLQQLYLNKSYAEISDFLVIEKVTVRSYVSSVLKKMGYTSSKAMVKDLTDLKIFENLSGLKNINGITDITDG